MTENSISHRHGVMALSPLILFVAVYLITSIIAGDFYKMPVTVAFLIACVYAIATCRRATLKQRIDTFCQGAGTGDIMLMVCIFVLAGAFANAAKAIGCIDATVNFTMSVMPDNMLMAGLFLAACFISLAIGTSVGTIVALTPIAAGLAHSTGTDVATMAAIIVGGSFFGDNLSFISDTTIVATSSQRCKQSDKFLVNSFTTIPVAILVMLLYVMLGSNVKAPSTIPDIDIVRILPYVVVIITAICGMNVMVVLTLGIVITGVIGLCEGAFDVFGFFHAMSEGIGGMGELIIVTIMAGGLLRILSDNGALQYLIQVMTSRISSKRSCELVIAMLVSIVNVCTANNTVAIITVGSISKSLSDRFGVDNRKSASILDTFSCCVQGVLPYGAQLLMAAGLAAVTPVEIIAHLYYPFVLFLVSVLAILVRYPRKYS